MSRIVFPAFDSGDAFVEVDMRDEVGKERQREGNEEILTICLVPKMYVPRQKYFLPIKEG